jgi:hypothetical protein
MTSEKKDLLSEVSRRAGTSPEKLRNTLEVFFEEIHRRMYEYDAGNGDYISEALSFELSDRAWIHLYQFLLLNRLRHGCEDPDDEISESSTQLQYMGGSARWLQYFSEMKDWKMSRRFGLDQALYQ